MNELSDQWQTPMWLFDELNKEFSFDIDLCATKENSKCELFGADYLIDWYEEKSTDTSHAGPRLGLDTKSFTCFMNPPYSNPKPFIEKAWEDSKHCKIVCLVKCDPSTRWWATFWDYGTEHTKLNCIQCDEKTVVRCADCYGKKFENEEKVSPETIARFEEALQSARNEMYFSDNILKAVQFYMDTDFDVESNGVNLNKAMEYLKKVFGHP